MSDFNFKNPDYTSVLKRRLETLNSIKMSEKKFAAFKLHYKEHPEDFVNDWVMTYDPRKENPVFPFVLFPKQREYLKWLLSCYKNKTDGLVEKSRDVGATWLNMAFSIWMWIFYPNSKIAFGSRKEMLVDKIGDPDSIFEKGRMILRFLPDIFLPNGFDLEKDATFMKIINRVNGSTITGESGDNIGRGGRSSIYFKDESAFYERPMRIEAALSQNSDVKIDVSTPNGTGNPFYEKRFSGKIPVFIFDWRDDPRKDDEWYQHQCDTLDPFIVAQEIDRDYGASVEDICIPSKFVNAAVDLELPYSGSIIGGLDVADEGRDANALVIRQGCRVLDIQSWAQGNTTQTARKAHSICVDKSVDILNYDNIGVGAGIKGELWSLASKKFKANGVNVGSTPDDGIFEEGKLRKDMFTNLKAQLWWELRRRFEKTFEYVNGDCDHPFDELISIPFDTELISELSQPKYEFNPAGKIKIESKQSMKKRGIASPNKADALILSFYMPTLPQPNIRML